MKKIIAIPVFCATLLLGGCRSSHTLTQKNNDLLFAATPAPEWDALFYRNHGWFGGDGIYSVSFSGLEKNHPGKNDSVLIWFSDTMIGEIADTLLPGEQMINNSLAIMHGSEPDTSAIQFLWNNNADSKPASVFVPQSPAAVSGEYYWLGDGFVNTASNNDIYIVGYRIVNIPGQAVFGFKQTGNTLIRIPSGDRPPFKRTVQIDIPFFAGQNLDSVGSFGSALLVNTRAAGSAHPDGYVYVYGIRGKNKQVIVARVKPANMEQFDRWRFWNGRSWSADITTLSPIADRSSNEMSVTPLQDGRYLMVFQKDAIGSKVGVRVGTSPVGPFGPIVDVYDVSDDLKESRNLIPYNAKAHPVLSRPGELLISYNINSLDFNTDIRKFPHLYRPRFIRLTYK